MHFSRKKICLILNGVLDKQSINFTLIDYTLNVYVLQVSFGSVVSHDGAYPNFYNPRQNGAARKFWSKNRQLKVINKDINKDINSSFTDNNMSGTEMSRSEVNTRVSSDIAYHHKVILFQYMTCAISN